MSAISSNLVVNNSYTGLTVYHPEALKTREECEYIISKCDATAIKARCASIILYGGLLVLGVLSVAVAVGLLWFKMSLLLGVAGSFIVMPPAIGLLALYSPLKTLVESLIDKVISTWQKSDHYSDESYKIGRHLRTLKW